MTSLYVYYYRLINFNVLLAYTPSQVSSSTYITKIERYTTQIRLHISLDHIEYDFWYSIINEAILKKDPRVLILLQFIIVIEILRFIK